MVELVIALGVFAIVASVTGSMLASGLRGTLVAKRREVATQEASRVLELARSLTYDELGLITTDPTIPGDDAIVDQAGVPSYLVDANTSLYEPIMWAGNASGHPFNPHLFTFDRGSSTLTTSVYVTGRDSDLDGEVDIKRVTARVAWEDAGTQGAENFVTAQTFVHSGGEGTQSGPGGVLTPMSATASSAGLTADVAVGVGNLNTGLNALLPPDSVVLRHATTSGSTRFRAISKIDCSARSLFLQDPTGATYGGPPVVVSADDDSRTLTPSDPPDDTSSGPTPVSAGDETTRLLAEAAVSGSASCSATAADADGVDPVDDGLPYEHGTASSGSQVNLVQDITGAGLSTDVLTLLRTGAQSADQEIDHIIPGTNRELHASARGEVGATKAMVISTLMPDGLVSVEPFTYEASLAASPETPSQAPSITSDLLTIKVFDPSSAVTGCTSRSGSYCVITVDPLSAAFDGLSVQLAGSLSANLGLTDIGFTIDVEALEPSADGPAGVPGPNGETRWQANYVPLSVSTTLAIDVDTLLLGTIRLIDAAANVNFGDVGVTGCAGLTCP